MRFGTPQMDLEREAARRIGTTLRNKWTLERLLGAGGMAAVYVGVHKIGRREAIKILYPDVAREPEMCARFEQEAHAVNTLKHPGAVEIRDIDVAEDGAPFLVMELLEGKPLAELARQPGGVPIEMLLRLADELLDVLVAAHAQGIIHRDIKPDNLFVQTDGRLKVLDFGIARVRAGASLRLKTRAGATLGTAPYMPPEQIVGAEIDHRADLFAVGATLFRLLTKRRLHEAANESELLVKMATVPPPPVCSVMEGLPPDLGLVVDRALEFNRDDRYPNAGTMQADIRALREGRHPPYATEVPVLRERTRAVAPAPPLAPLAGSLEIPALLPDPLHAAEVEPVTRAATAQPVNSMARPIPSISISVRSPGGSGAIGTELTELAGGAAVQGFAEPGAHGSPDAGGDREGDTKWARNAAVAPAPALTASGFAAMSTPPAPATSSTGAVPPTWPNHEDAPPGGREATMRSVLGAAAPGGAVRLHGQPVEAPVAGSPAAGRGGTQVIPTVPAQLGDPRPGASIPVVAATPPKRPIIDPTYLPILLVGVLFATIGVFVTLWVMLSRGAPPPSDPAATATGTVAPPPAETQLPSIEGPPHGPAHSRSATPARPSQHPGTQPSPFPLPGFPGVQSQPQGPKGPHHGH